MVRWVRIAFVFAAVFAFVMAVLPEPPRVPGNPSDKTQHMLAFAVLGALAALAFPKRSVLPLVAALATFGAIIELVQGVPGLNRETDLIDLLADIIAALIAVWTARTLWSFVRER